MLIAALVIDVLTMHQRQHHWIKHFKSIMLERYQKYGWDYDSNNPPNEKEVQWHVKYAGPQGNRVLELACGTGRLLVRLAESGFDVTGIDLSPQMLDIAGDRIRRSPETVKNRIKLVCGDITDFHLAKRYDLIYITDNSFRELATKESQQSLLQAVNRHLLPDGSFLLSVKPFDDPGAVKSKKESSWTQPTTDPQTGRLISRKVFFEISEGYQTGCYLYKTTDFGGNETIEEFPFVSPVMHINDYLDLFKKNGLSAQIFYDFREESKGKPQVLCFVCKRVFAEDKWTA